MKKNALMMAKMTKTGLSLVPFVSVGSMLLLVVSPVLAVPKKTDKNVIDTTIVTIGDVIRDVHKSWPHSIAPGKQYGVPVTITNLKSGQ